MVAARAVVAMVAARAAGAPAAAMAAAARAAARAAAAREAVARVAARAGDGRRLRARAHGDPGSGAAAAVLGVQSAVWAAVWAAGCPHPAQTTCTDGRHGVGAVGVRRRKDEGRGGTSRVPAPPSLHPPACRRELGACASARRQRARRRAAKEASPRRRARRAQRASRRQSRGVSVMCICPGAAAVRAHVARACEGVGGAPSSVRTGSTGLGCGS